jgi:hypothetical protein
VALYLQKGAEMKREEKIRRWLKCYENSFGITKEGEVVYFEPYILTCMIKGQITGLVKNDRFIKIPEFEDDAEPEVLLTLLRRRASLGFWYEIQIEDKTTGEMTPDEALGFIAHKLFRPIERDHLFGLKPIKELEGKNEVD